MPVNPHRKGGPDIPVVDGGTDASDATTGLANLGGLDVSSHALIDHTGVLGVGSPDDAATESVTLGSGTSISRVVPGGTLAVNNESLDFEIWGAETGGVSHTNVTLMWGATLLFNLPAISANGIFVIRGSIVRTGPTTQRWFFRNLVGAGARNGTGTAAETLSAASTLSATATPGTPVLSALIIRKRGA